MCDIKKDGRHAHTSAAGIAPPLPERPLTPFEKGYNAWVEGKGLLDNPYEGKKQQTPHMEWTKGYVTASMAYTDEQKVRTLW